MSSAVFGFKFFLQATNKQQLSMNWKFHIPDLKVGTLDQLVGLSDDLGKIIKIAPSDSYYVQNAPYFSL